MAKKKAKKKPAVKEEGAWIVTDHGIYAETSFNGNASPEELAEAEDKIRDSATRRSPTLSALQQVHSLRQRMQSTISLAIIPEGAGLNGRWATVTADLGGGAATHLCHAETTAGVEESASVLTAVDVFLNDEPSEREAQMFLSGITVGRLLERIQIRPLEFMVLDSKATQSGRSNGGRTRATFKSKSQELLAIAIIQRYYRPPTVLMTAACLRAAPAILKELGVDAKNKTLQRLWNKHNNGQC